MTITCAEADHLTYESRIVKVETQRRLEVLDADRQRSQPFHSICSCFKKVMLESVGWLEVGDVALGVRLLASENIPRPQLIEGMTPEEFILRNADPFWLHMNGMWEYMPVDESVLLSPRSESE